MRGPRLGNLGALLVGLALSAGSTGSQAGLRDVPQWVPEQYRSYFVHYVDDRSALERALNQIGWTREATGRSFALVAGISRYPKMQGKAANLKPAADDVAKLVAYLKNHEFFNEIVVLENQDVTLQNLQYFLTNYFPRRLRQAPKSRFLFAYSGHGMTESNRGFILTTEATSLEDRYDAISMAVLRGIFQDVVDTGYQVLALINACYGGSFLNMSFGDRDYPPRREGAHAITAGTRGELTWHDPDFGAGTGSVFFEAVLAGLDGRADHLPEDGLITMKELDTYLSGTISEFTDGQQNPQSGDLNPEQSPGGFFFFDRRRQVEARVTEPFDHATAVAFGRRLIEGAKRTPPAVSDPRVAEAALNLREREAVQRALTALDFDTRGVDGVFGPNTWRAIVGWQSSRGEQPTGFLTATQYESLLAEAERKVAALGSVRREPEPARPVQPAVGIYDQDPPYEPGDEFQDCDDCPLMVVVPAGSFTMGSTEERTWAVEQGGKQEWVDPDKPQHPVTIERPLAVGKYEVTVGQFRAFVQATDHDMSGGCREFTGSEWKANASNNWRAPGFEQTESHPVVCVSWDDAKTYAVWLSEKTRRQYRLLSEAEWEYAARADTITRYWWGDDEPTPEQANFGGNVRKTTEVGSDPYPANPWGLYDMNGNVWEWVEDCVNSYAEEGRPDDGSAWTTGDCSHRVTRGGSWYHHLLYLRSAYRGGGWPGYRGYDVGFRVARTLSPSESVTP